MKKIISLDTERSSEQISRTTNKMKNLVAGIVMSLFVLGATPAKPQDKTSAILQDTTKIEQISKPKSSGSLMIDPLYSPTDKTTVVRFEGCESLHGIKIGGLVDFSGTDQKQGISTAFGKLTVSKNIMKTTSGAVEYTLSTAGADKIRAGVTQILTSDGSVILKVYPISDKGFEPFVLIGTGVKIGKKVNLGAFLSSDIKSKCYYGEGEMTIGSGRIQGMGQVRVSGTYSSKPKAGTYLGVRVKL